MRIPRTAMSPGLRRGLALAVLLAWALHSWAMAQEYSLAIMCWSCHVATLAVAAGLWRGHALLAAAGSLFHLSVGLPSWLVETLVSGRWFPTSVLIHVFPPAAGLLYLRRAGELPRGAVPVA
ncbi:MAG: hypothetical protein SCH98_05555 [Deferrisomatales bacterium]|nr:hypothetical protein [Deferrisomatales bacterium]